jgi:hypothetical protein
MQQACTSINRRLPEMSVHKGNVPSYINQLPVCEKKHNVLPVPSVRRLCRAPLEMLHEPEWTEDVEALNPTTADLSVGVKRRYYVDICLCVDASGSQAT